MMLAMVLVPWQPGLARETNDLNQPAEAAKKRVFNFEGGNPFEFISALDRHFRTRLVQVLTLPEVFSRSRVPKLQVVADDPREVLTLYNRLDNPALGQWRFEPDLKQKSSDTNMNVLMLVPDKGTASAKVDASAIKVKALPLAGVPEKQWNAMLKGMEEASALAEKIADERTVGAPRVAGEFSGRVRIQPESRILVVIGTSAFLEMAESYLNAYRMNTDLEAKAATPTTPTEAK